MPELRSFLKANHLAAIGLWLTVGVIVVDLVTDWLLPRSFAADVVFHLLALVCLVFGLINTVIALRRKEDRRLRAPIGVMGILIGALPLVLLAMGLYMVGQLRDVISPREDMASIERKVGFTPLVPTSVPKGIEPVGWRVGRWQTADAAVIEFSRPGALEDCMFDEGDCDDVPGFTLHEQASPMKPPRSYTTTKTLSIDGREARWWSGEDPGAVGIVTLTVGQVQMLVLTGLSEEQTIEMLGSLRPYDQVDGPLR